MYGVPVDLGHRGRAVADAGEGVHEAGEVTAVQEPAVADEQLVAGFVWVMANPQSGGVSLLAKVTVLG